MGKFSIKSITIFVGSIVILSLLIPTLFNGLANMDINADRITSMNNSNNMKFYVNATIESEWNNTEISIYDTVILANYTINATEDYLLSFNITSTVNSSCVNISNVFVFTNETYVDTFDNVFNCCFSFNQEYLISLKNYHYNFMIAIILNITSNTTLTSNSYIREYVDNEMVDIINSIVLVIPIIAIVVIIIYVSKIKKVF